MLDAVQNNSDPSTVANRCFNQRKLFIDAINALNLDPKSKIELSEVDAPWDNINNLKNTLGNNSSKKKLEVINFYFNKIKDLKKLIVTSISKILNSSTKMDVV